MSAGGIIKRKLKLHSIMICEETGAFPCRKMLPVDRTALIDKKFNVQLYKMELTGIDNEREIW